jgi:hypothetical protein
MARAIFKYEDVTARRVAGELSRKTKQMRRVLLAEMRASAPELTEPFETYALYDLDERDDYHMRDHVTATVAAAGRITTTIRIDAISPESGYDYLDVTRFGHRGTLRAKRTRFLRWEDAEGLHFARETAGFHPPTDWVEDAQPVAEQVAGDVAERAGRAVYTRLLT